jgi:hypothetical protein
MEKLPQNQANLSGDWDSGHQLSGSKHLQIQPLLLVLLFQCTIFSLELLFVIDRVHFIVLPSVRFLFPVFLYVRMQTRYVMSVRLVLRFAQRCGWGFRASGPTRHFDQKSDPDVARRRNANRSCKNSSKYGWPLKMKVLLCLEIRDRMTKSRIPEEGYSQPLGRCSRKVKKN